MRQRLREVSDWRTWLALFAVVAAFAVAYTVVESVRIAHDALAAQRTTAAQAAAERATASARITTLQGQIDDLLSQSRSEATTITRLQAAVVALERQVRSLGGTPVVVNVTEPSASPQPSPRPSPSHKPHPTPSPKPSPSPTPLVCVRGICEVR